MEFSWNQYFIVAFPLGELEILGGKLCAFGLEWLNEVVQRLVVFRVGYIWPHLSILSWGMGLLLCSMGWDGIVPFPAWGHCWHCPGLLRWAFKTRCKPAKDRCKKINPCEGDDHLEINSILIFAVVFLLHWWHVARPSASPSYCFSAQLLILVKRNKWFWLGYHGKERKDMEVCSWFDGSGEIFHKLAARLALRRADEWNFPAWCYRLEGNYTRNIWQRELAEVQPRVLVGAEWKSQVQKEILWIKNEPAQSGRSQHIWLRDSLEMSVIPFGIGTEMEEFGTCVLLTGAICKRSHQGPRVAPGWNLSTRLFFYFHCREVSHWTLFSQFLLPGQNKQTNKLGGESLSGVLWPLNEFYLCLTAHGSTCALSWWHPRKDWVGSAPFQPCQKCKVRWALGCSLQVYPVTDVPQPH